LAYPIIVPSEEGQYSYEVSNEFNTKNLVSKVNVPLLGRGMNPRPATKGAYPLGTPD
jgi:hypothetical protein